MKESLLMYRKTLLPLLMFLLTIALFVVPMEGTVQGVDNEEVLLEKLLSSPHLYVGRVVTLRGYISWIKGNEFCIEEEGYSLLLDRGPPWSHSIDVTEGELVMVTGQLGYKGPPLGSHLNPRNGSL